MRTARTFRAMMVTMCGINGMQREIWEHIKAKVKARNGLDIMAVGLGNRQADVWSLCTTASPLLRRVVGRCSRINPQDEEHLSSGNELATSL